jgi:5'-deoxynucleotidase YfbR-like HD superfamily hydrolase
MDNLNQETPKAAETASVEKWENGAATDLGKFKDVEALMTAYKNLEAEFTRRSTRLKELEAQQNTANGANNERELAEKVQGNEHLPVAPSVEELTKAAMENEEIKKAIIGQYVTSLSAAKSVPLMTGGTTVAATRNVPKTIKEAGALALKHLKQ